MESATNKSSVVHTVKRTKRRSNSTTGVDVQLQPQLMSIVTESHDTSELADKTLSLLRDTLGLQQIALLTRDSSGSQIAIGQDLLSESLPPGAMQKVAAWSAEAAANQSVQIHALAGAHQWEIITVPVAGLDASSDVLIAAHRTNTDSRQQIAPTLQMAATAIACWHQSQQKHAAQMESRQSAALLELLAKLDASDSLINACFCLTNETRDYLGCQQVFVGLANARETHCHLAAVSGLSGFDKRSQLTSGIEAALNESIVHSRLTVVSADLESENAGNLAHENLRTALQARTLVTSPLLSHAGDVIGAWILVDDVPPRPELINFMRSGQAMIGSKLMTIKRDTANPLMRMMRSMVALAISRKFVLAILIGCFTMALMLVPMDYRIGCDCQLEPVSRRFVASPYDGTLKESLVEAGELVTAGQVLAKMDPRELHWELSGLEADYKSEEKNRDAASARDEVALAQQSALEMKRLQLKMQLINHRLENLEIKSPIDGVVIAGDLKKSEGAPLTIGQSIFEIGPLDEMIVEVAVPERDILYVQAGQQVDLRLDAARGQSDTGTIKRVFPRAEMRGTESVYIAEVDLSNSAGRLRPGMKGTAKIVSDPHTLGWILFHKAWESLAMMIGC